MERFRPRLLMNMLEDPKDAEKAQKIRRSCKEYLNIDVEHLGVLYRDEMQDVALAAEYRSYATSPNRCSRRHSTAWPTSSCPPKTRRTYSLSLAEIEGGYRTAELEAEADFGAKAAYVEELLSSGALTVGELVDAVRSQQFEIDKPQTRESVPQAQARESPRPGLRRLGSHGNGPKRGERRPRPRR